MRPHKLKKIETGYQVPPVFPAPNKLVVYAPELAQKQEIDVDA